MKNKFCIYCGTENNEKSKVCKKCGKALKGKPHEFLKYLKSKIKEDLTQDVDDKFWSILTNFLKSHLYGTVVSLSVIFTATSLVVTNINNNYVESVTTKPAFTPKYTYLGEGLTGQEICDKYQVALENNDIQTIKGLQLETFYPEVRKELEDYYNDGISAGEEWYNLPILKHDLVVNGHIYFSSEEVKNDDNYVVQNRSHELKSTTVNCTGKYNDYAYERYYFFMHHWSGIEYAKDIERNYPEYLNSSSDSRTVDNGKVYGTFVRGANDIIELIEIDGNYYVNGEDSSPFDTLGDLTDRKYILENYGGDITNVSMIMEHINEFPDPLQYAFQDDISPSIVEYLNQKWLDFD